MKILNLLLALPLSLLLSACVNLKPSPDESRSFVLGPTDMLATGAASDVDEPAVFLLRPQLPAYLDRDEIVYRDSSGEVKAIEDAFWAEPLPDGIARGLSQFLGATRDQSGIRHYPWPEPANEVNKLSIGFYRLNATEDGALQVAASYSLRRPDGSRESGDLAPLELEWDTSNPETMVVALNEALRQIAKELDVVL